MSIMRLTRGSYAPQIFGRQFKQTVAAIECSARHYAVERRKLFDLLECKIKEERKRIIKFRKEHGNTIIGECSVNMLYGGMRGMKALVWETSFLDPNEGIRYRGLTIADICKQLPKAECGQAPLPEGVLWLLLTGEKPTQPEVMDLSKELASRATLPKYIEKIVKSFPKDLHPMSQFAAAITAMNRDSKFAKSYSEGSILKMDYWVCIYEDCLDLIAKLVPLAGLIYCHSFLDKDPPKYDPNLDWSANLVKMMGFDNAHFNELMRLYLCLHACHEGGNVSAHTTHLVGSALSDPYLSYAAAINGLAGPLHGLANQEVINWVRLIMKEHGKDPSEDKLKDFVQKTLKSGQVVPGYGHAVLRKTDPRYVFLREFAVKNMPNDETYKIIEKLYKVVPPALKALGKVKSPWPNVDANSGVLLLHYGVHQMNFFTVLFGVSRALGALAQLVWSRALLLPIERPRSFTTDALIAMVKDIEKKKKAAKKEKK